MQKLLDKLDRKYRGYILEFTSEYWLMKNAETGQYILAYDKYPEGCRAIAAAKSIVDKELGLLNAA